MTKTVSFLNKAILNLMFAALSFSGLGALAGGPSTVESPPLPKVSELLELRKDLEANKDLSETDAVDLLLYWFVPLQTRVDEIKKSGVVSWTGVSIESVQKSLDEIYQMFVCRGLLTDETIRIRTKRVVSPCFDGKDFSEVDEARGSTQD